MPGPMYEDDDDEPEPLPLKPAKSDGLCVRSGHRPLQDLNSGFGPSERTLSRHVPAVVKEPIFFQTGRTKKKEESHMTHSIHQKHG